MVSTYYGPILLVVQIHDINFYVWMQSWLVANRIFSKINCHFASVLCSLISAARSVLEPLCSTLGCIPGVSRVARQHMDIARRKVSAYSAWVVTMIERFAVNEQRGSMHLYWFVVSRWCPSWPKPCLHLARTNLVGFFRYHSAEWSDELLIRACQRVLGWKALFCCQ